MAAVHRVEVRPRSGHRDVRGESVARQAASLGIPAPREARHASVYLLEGELSAAQVERIARELGGSITQAAASLLASATAKGPAAIPSLAILGRIIGATWAEKRTEAGNKAAGNAALVAALQGALSQPRDPVRVVASAPGGRKSDTMTRAEAKEALGF